MCMLLSTNRQEDPLQVAATASSFLSSLYGIADDMAYQNQVYPSRLWALATFSCDFWLRQMLMAYAIFLGGIWALTLPASYFFLMLARLLPTKSLSCTEKVIDAIGSWVNSASCDLGANARAWSKLIFNLMALAFLITLTYLVIQLDEAPVEEDCDPCRKEGDKCLLLPRFVHLASLAFIWSLWTLSSIEGVLEKHLDIMPYNVFYHVSKSSSPDNLEVAESPKDLIMNFNGDSNVANVQATTRFGHSNFEIGNT